MQQRIRVLIIEDAQRWRDIIREELESCDCDVDMAGDHQEARRQLERQRYDMVTLDMALSDDEEPQRIPVTGSSGWRLLVNTILRTSPESAVYVISASFDLAPKRAFEMRSKYGVRDFMTKSEDFDPATLRVWVDAVRGAIMQRATQAPPASVQDSFSHHERGLLRLLQALSPQHERYSEVLTYQHRLQEAIRQARLHGDNELLRSVRSMVITELDAVALAELRSSFQQLCGDE
jgi:CheY-like chemotaxis protein